MSEEKKFIENRTFGEDRALYRLENAFVAGCRFTGTEDGESAMKEAENIEIHDSIFRLRYPLWHSRNVTISRIQMSDTCRAAIWYGRNIRIASSTLGGIKALRECDGVVIDDCDIYSTEFGWMMRNGEITDSRMSGEYPFMRGENLKIEKLRLDGKYSFQYTKNVTVEDSEIDTKDAFWHSENVTIRNSVIRGEYFGWYSRNLTLINCTIDGRQPCCQAENMVLENCRVIGEDSFENSSVKADLIGKLESVKDPLSGEITADTIGKVIVDEWARGKAEIKERK